MSVPGCWDSALTLYPFLATFYWSFCRYDLLTPPEPVGVDNYARLADELVHGGRFGQAVWNTIYYAGLSVPLSIAVGVGLAVLLSAPVRGQSVYRTLVFLPSVVPVVASSILWMWILDPQAGVVNRVLALFGISGPGWFKSTAEAAWLPAWLHGGRIRIKRCAGADEPVGRWQFHDHLSRRAGRHSQAALRGG